MVIQMERLVTFVRDYIRLMSGRPVVGALPERSSAEEDGRSTAPRFARGSVTLQANRFATDADTEREWAEVADVKFRN